MKLYFLSFTCLLFSFLLQGQHIDIFPSSTGNQLLFELKEEYKPSVVLPYDEARDTLFGVVDLVNDSLECIYSGHKVFIPEGADPTTAAYQNGSNNGINTEHTYPQSLWSGGNSPKSDMHHLFPTRAQVNNSRSSDPFADINDNFVDTWFYKDMALSSEPSASTKDLYSEDTNSFFEPRESVKGDIARAMFYFYTMYKNEADAVNNSFFQSQLSTLCEWHANDPTDLKEAIRTWKISEYQEYKPNPFVLDCTLASRANYCSGISEYCTIISSNDDYLLNNGITLFPNPAHENIRITLDPELLASDITLKILDVSGKLLMIQDVKEETELEINIDSLPKGMLIFQFQTPTSFVSKKLMHL